VIEMERTFEERPTHPGTAEQSPTSLLGEVLAVWPTAPVAEVGGSGRWLTFARPGGGTVYLQRSAWDDGTVPHYLVVVPAGPDRAEQHRYLALGEAIQKLRRLLVCGTVPRRGGLLEELTAVATPADRRRGSAPAA
jgi:hypothetical protein